MKRKHCGGHPSSVQPRRKCRLGKSGQEWIRANWGWVSCFAVIVCAGVGFGQLVSSTANHTIVRLDDALEDRPSAGAVKDFRDIQWSALIPKDWVSPHALKDMNLSALRDSDPRASRALTSLQNELARAPVDHQWNGERVRIAGYVVPLERVQKQLKEFLLVPYYGACIHVPPPPANQIIRVVADVPIKGIGVMDAVWVTGVLSSRRQGDRDRDSISEQIVAGYEMIAGAVTPYRKP